MNWIPAANPINENRRAQAVEKAGIIGTDRYIYLTYMLKLRRISLVMRLVLLVCMTLKTNA